MSDLVFRTATELARMIREKKISSVELTKAFLTQIERHNDRINAVVTLNDKAVERAAESDESLSRNVIDGPLHGVPVTIKDCFETAGIRTTSSYPPLKNHLPEESATAVQRLEEAGAIILGKTNLPLLATDWQTHSPLFGDTRNPWNPDRIPGGSSGGSAAAVASGFSAADLGSDIGGSIRVPSHCCGVFGFKPSEHRVSGAGHIPDWHIPGTTKGERYVRHMGVYGPIARSVEDLQLIFDLIHGPDNRETEIPDLPIQAVGEIPLKQCRFAWTDTFGDLKGSRETREQIGDLVFRLREAGCMIEHEPLSDIAFHDLWFSWGVIVATELGNGMSWLLRQSLRLKYTMLSDHSSMKKGMVKGTRLKMPAYAEALRVRERFVRRLNALLADYDALICPVAATPAVEPRKVGEPIIIDGSEVFYFPALGGFATPFSLSGHPSVMLPVGFSSENLPIGIQLVGRRWQDEKLLSIAQSLEQLTGSFRKPDLQTI